MSNHNIRIGKFGEHLAADFLKSKNCEIIDKNFYTRWGEIDLIAKYGDEFLFCEVKTRTGDNFGYPEYAVDKNKTRNLLKAINVYIRNKNINQFWRLDIISVRLNTKTKTANIKWFKNITI